MPKVKLPTGEVVKFPDTMSQDEILRTLKSKYPPQPTLPPEEPPTALEAAGRGLGQGLTFGFSDELAGVKGSLEDAYNKGDISYDQMVDAYSQARDVAREKDAAAKATHPGAYTGGELAGGLATALLPGSAAVTAGRAIGLGAGLGAVQAAGYSEEGGSKLVGDIASGAALGAAGGGILAGAGKVVSETKKLSGLTGRVDEAKAAKERAGISKKIDEELGAPLTTKELLERYNTDDVVIAMARQQEDLLKRAHKAKDQYIAGDGTLKELTKEGLKETKDSIVSHLKAVEVADPMKVVGGLGFMTAINPSVGLPLAAGVITLKTLSSPTTKKIINKGKEQSLKIFRKHGVKKLDSLGQFVNKITVPGYEPQLKTAFNTLGYTGLGAAHISMMENDAKYRKKFNEMKKKKKSQ